MKGRKEGRKDEDLISFHKSYAVSSIFAPAHAAVQKEGKGRGGRKRRCTE